MAPRRGLAVADRSEKSRGWMVMADIAFFFVSLAKGFGDGTAYIRMRI